MSESSYIDGIFNYCDRWCERCAFTAQCRTFAMQERFRQAEEAGVDPKDIDWKAFWRGVGLSFEQTPRDWLGELDDSEEAAEFDLGITFVESDEQAVERDFDERHPLVVGAHDYMEATSQWLGEHANGAVEPSHSATSVAPEPATDDKLELLDAIAVIRWYHTMIPVKLDRALSGLLGDENLDEPWAASVQDELGDMDEITDAIREADSMDSAGSGKVAIISIERSIGAWTAVRTVVPALADSVAPLQRLLGWLRIETDRVIPDARTFCRPGFDD